MKIFVTGTRGIPDIPGGVEKHCQELYPFIVLAGHDVILATRRPYVQHEQKQWQGVQLCHIVTLRHKNFEAIIHTFLAVIKAGIMHADIIHIHGVGPALMVPFAKMLGIKVVFTHHGPDYNRSKWGKIAKAILRFGEYVGETFSDQLIVISPVIRDLVKERCKRHSYLIYNGVSLPKRTHCVDFLKENGIQPNNYLLAVARFVPEKGLHDLLEAFKNARGNYQLVLAGDADHETDYSRRLKQLAKDDSRVILTGYISGDELNQVFSNAKLFIMPSYHEGLPIALLEAMSFSLPVLISDIPAHREFNINPARYFQCGKKKALQEGIERIVNVDLTIEEEAYYQYELGKKYNWLKIAEQTIRVYKAALRD